MDQSFPSFKYVVSQLILRFARESFPLCYCTTMISTKIVDSFQNSGSQWHLRWILHYFYVSVSQQFYLQDVALIVYRHLNKLTLNHQIGLEKTSELKTPKFIWTYIYFTVFSLVENNSKLKGNQRFSSRLQAGIHRYIAILSCVKAILRINNEKNCWYHVVENWCFQSSP